MLKLADRRLDVLFSRYSAPLTQKDVIFTDKLAQTIHGLSLDWITMLFIQLLYQLPTLQKFLLSKPIQVKIQTINGSTFSFLMSHVMLIELIIALVACQNLNTCIYSGRTTTIQNSIVTIVGKIRNHRHFCQKCQGQNPEHVLICQKTI